jgi:hypothetical protein
MKGVHVAKANGKTDWDKLSWSEFNLALRDVTEQEAQKMLESERHSRKRSMYMLRLYGKFSMLRKRRERRELLKDMLS